MYLIQIKHAQIKFPLFGFWTVWVPGVGADAPSASVPYILLYLESFFIY